MSGQPGFDIFGSLYGAEDTVVYRCTGEPRDTVEEFTMTLTLTDLTQHTWKATFSLQNLVDQPDEYVAEANDLLSWVMRVFTEGTPQLNWRKQADRAYVWAYKPLIRNHTQEFKFPGGGLLPVAGDAAVAYKDVALAMLAQKTEEKRMMTSELAELRQLNFELQRTLQAKARELEELKASSNLVGFTPQKHPHIPTDYAKAFRLGSQSPTAPTYGATQSTLYTTASIQPSIYGASQLSSQQPSMLAPVAPSLSAIPEASSTEAASEEPTGLTQEAAAGAEPSAPAAAIGRARVVAGRGRGRRGAGSKAFRLG